MNLISKTNNNDINKESDYYLNLGVEKINYFYLDENVEIQTGAVYIEKLIISPLKFNITFTSKASKAETTNNPIFMILKVL